MVHLTVVKSFINKLLFLSDYKQLVIRHSPGHEWTVK